MKDVWLVTNWQALQWVRDPTPISRMNSFQPFQCDYSVSIEQFRLKVLHKKLLILLYFFLI